ncbi:hypothetical protein EDD17DRAFT_1510446 [Pisolithus thermaeus]|nr:hypothetical protein EDD17DRAFT_1510446 [Pisolithus thermaeus]
MLYYRDYESYESQSRHESPVQRSSSSFEGQLVVEWLQSAPRPLDGMPRGKADDVPRFSGHPEDLLQCPAVQYLKHDLYNLIDKQKMVKINSYKALLDYRLHFTKVTQEAERLLEKGYRLDLMQACMAREQSKAEYEARTQESRSRKAHERCNEKSDSLKLSKVPGGSLRGQALEVDSSEVAVAEPSCSPLVEGQWRTSTVQAKWEEQNKEELLGTKPSVKLEATEAMGNIPEPQSKYLHSSSSPHTDNLPQNPLNEPQEALDKTRTVERPVKPAAHALKIPKPPLEPKDDLHEAPEQAGSRKVEEVKQKIEAEMQSKVVARRKPPEKKTRRKGLKSVIWRMKDIIPGLWTAHSNAGMDSESWCRDLCDKSKRT